MHDSIATEDHRSETACDDREKKPGCDGVLHREGLKETRLRLASQLSPVHVRELARKSPAGAGPKFITRLARSAYPAAAAVCKASSLCCISAVAGFD